MKIKAEQILATDRIIEGSESLAVVSRSLLGEDGKFTLSLKREDESNVIRRLSPDEEVEIEDRTQTKDEVRRQMEDKLEFSGWGGYKGKSGSTWERTFYPSSDDQVFVTLSVEDDKCSFSIHDAFTEGFIFESSVSFLGHRDVIEYESKIPSLLCDLWLAVKKLKKVAE